MLTLLTVSLSVAAPKSPISATITQCGDPIEVVFYPPHGTPSPQDLLIEPGIRSGIIRAGAAVDVQALRRYGWVAHLPTSPRYPYRWYTDTTGSTDASIATMTEAIATCDLIAEGGIDVGPGGRVVGTLIDSPAFFAPPYQIGTTTLAEARSTFCQPDCLEEPGEFGPTFSRGPLALYFADGGALTRIQNDLSDPDAALVGQQVTLSGRFHYAGIAAGFGGASFLLRGERGTMVLMDSPAVDREMLIPLHGQTITVKCTIDPANLPPQISSYPIEPGAEPTDRRIICVVDELIAAAPSPTGQTSTMTPPAPQIDEQALSQLLEAVLFKLSSQGVIGPVETDDVVPPDYYWSFNGEDMSASAEDPDAVKKLLKSLTQAQRAALGADLLDRLQRAGML